ncbi:FliH/SctL family protein [Fulvimonas soli]|jgi:flagellar assembly protein FliH|uniref:Flagellar assembly protein FliH n=1 Tax=Fulvimonas soli TaxID=155197 RepID=A0A316HPB8_9GAMM|nr:FliH/SctL family protein [Fulvimonas soli]PWK83078.1 flagellar assembly protein FliH [Fulvimonas soli]TNY26122.1 flagellar assembly protein FliH [Fulvimonas soli]
MSGVLNREEVAAFQRWELPLVGEAPAPEPSGEAPRPTVSELEALERQAREEGYAAGRREGLADAQRELAARLARLDALLAAAARPLEALDAAVEQELARLALVAARQVLAHELKTDPALVVHAVRQAALALPAATRELRVHLHPDDLALLRSLDAAEPHWRLLPDPALARGDCRIESESSRLDARVEARLAAVIDAVLGAGEDDDGAGEAGA